MFFGQTTTIARYLIDRQKAGTWLHPDRCIASRAFSPVINLSRFGGVH
jgi:hypothetical protein